MAPTADLGNLPGRRFSDETLPAVVSVLLILLPRVAPVAEDAGETGLRVHVVGEELRRRGDSGIVEDGVALDTSVDCRRRF
jgi:hypothetical protein